MQTLHTPRLVLEPLVAAHADALYPLLADARMAEFLDHGPPASLPALRERYGRLESRRSGDGREHWLNWALLRREDAARSAIGVIQATVLEDGRAWVAYEVGCAWWGHGIATEATRAMLDHLAQHYAVTQCLATVDKRNERSWRLLERLGFRQASADEADALEVHRGDWLYRRQPLGGLGMSSRAT